MANANADRNLLFGILALQMDFISRDTLISAMHALILDKSKTLGQILLEQMALDPDSHALLEALVQKHLALHGHDPEKSLGSLSTLDSVREELKQIADPDVQASLAHVSVARNDQEDPHATRGSSVGTPTSAGQRFRILRPHRKGGLGEVFVAHDEELPREVALKEIQGRYADDPERRTRFLLEAEITGALEHPGVVPVYGLGHYSDGRPFYAMRFIKGDSLKEAIEHFHEAKGAGQDPTERNLEFRKLLGRFMDVCNAVAYAHSKGVVHRDLKPGNIMLGKYGETLVVDWGLAKVLNQPAVADSSAGSLLKLPSAGDSTLTQIGSVIGTPQFMSPEQAEGRLDELGPRNDVYSLGATLYCLLTGRAPFEHAEVCDMLAKVVLGDFPPPRQIRRDVRPALEAICLKAMALQPKDRYASPRALADDIEKWLADVPVSAWPEPWTVRGRRWLGRHRTLVTSAAAVVLVGIVGLAVGLVLLAEANERERIARTNAQDERDAANLNLYAAHMNLAQREWEAAHLGRVLELLEEQRPKRAGDKDLRGWEWFYQERLCHDDLCTLNCGTRVSSVAFSQDGQWLASVSGSGGTVKVWAAVSGRQLRTLHKRHIDGVVSVAFSPDGQRLASASRDGTVKIWDVASGQELRTLKGHARVSSVAFSPDGQRLASASGDGTVKVWDIESGQELRTLRGHIGGIESVAFSPDGQRLASASGKYKRSAEVKVWDAVTGKEVLTLKGHADFVRSVAFSPDGERLASGDGETVKVWDTSSGQELRTLKGHTKEVWGVAFSPDGQRLASASHDQTVKLWDAASGRQLRTLKGHTGEVNTVVFSPDGQRLASASGDGTVKVWDTFSGQEFRTLESPSHGNWGLSVAFSPDGQRLASSSGGIVEVCDAVSGMVLRTLKSHAGGVRGVAFSPDGQRLAAASRGGFDMNGRPLPGEVKVWDAASGQELHTLKGHTADVYSVAFSPDGRQLVSAGEGLHDQEGRFGELKVWDAATGRELRTFKGHDAEVLSVAFWPDGQRLASASRDQTVKIWDVAKGQELRTVRVQDPAVRSQSVAFSPDGQRLASGEGNVEVRDAASGVVLSTLKGHNAEITSVAFSPDGWRLASASRDQTVRIWDVASGQELRTLKGDTSVVGSVAFSPDGQWLASVSEDGTVKVWDARPLTPEVEAEREALGLVDFLFAKPLLKGDVIESIRDNKTIDDEVRKQALVLVERFREEQDLKRFAQASRTLVRQRYLAPRWYRQALEQAKAACRLQPEDGNYLNTLGLAQYRLGNYQEALDTLSRSDKLNSASSSGTQPADIAFLAMAYHQLGQKEKAQASLDRLREIIKQPKWAKNGEAQGFLREAEESLKEQPIKPKN